MENKKDIMFDFPSMKAEEEEGTETDKRTASGQPILNFNNSPGMEEAQAVTDELDALDAVKNARFQREMENIKKFGPLNRMTERVLTEEEEAEQDEAEE